MFERRQFGSSRRRVIFFIGGYRTTIAMYRPLYWLMNLLGYRVYAYVLDSKTVIRSDIKAYVGQIQAIQQDIAGELASLPNDIAAFTMGNSLGSESALYALKHTPQLRAAALVTFRGAIAEFIWNTKAGRGFKPAYVNNGYDFAKLSHELEVVEPRKGLNLVDKRPVYLYYSDADRVIPISNSQLLLNDLQKTVIPINTRHYKHLGHGAAAIVGLGAFWRWHRLFRQA